MCMVMVSPVDGQGVDEPTTLVHSLNYHEETNGGRDHTADSGMVARGEGVPLIQPLEGLQSQTVPAVRTSSTFSRISRTTDRFPSVVIREESMMSFVDDSFIPDPLKYMLLFVLIGFVARMRNWGALSVFGLNALGILPLGVLLSRFTRVLVYTKTAAGFMLHAFLRNWVELTVAISALFQSKYSVLKSFLLGSMVCNQLVVSGVHIVALYVSGVTFEDNVDHLVTESSFALTWLIMTSFLIPSAVMYTTFVEQRVVYLSRACAILLLVFYICILVSEWPFLSGNEDVVSDSDGRGDIFDDEEDDAFDSVEFDRRGNELTPAVAAILLVLTLSATLLCCAMVISSISDAARELGLPVDLLAFTVLPFVGNMTEFVNAGKNESESRGSIGNAIGSSVLIGIFIFPTMEILGWICGRSLSLALSPTQCVIIVVATAVTSYSLRSKMLTWVQGAGMLFTFVICGLGVLYEHS